MNRQLSEECPRGKVAKVLDWKIIVSELVIIIRM